MQIQKQKAEAVKVSLRGTWKAEHLFALRQAVAGWEFYHQQRIGECDEQIRRELRELAALFWRLMVHGMNCVEEGLKKYETRVARTKRRWLIEARHWSMGKLVFLGQ